MLFVLSLRVDFKLPNDLRGGSELGVATARSARRKEHDKGENKEYRANALACDRDDYIFDCAMKNPTPATNKTKSSPNGLLFLFYPLCADGDLNPRPTEEGVSIEFDRRLWRIKEERDGRK